MSKTKTLSFLHTFFLYSPIPFLTLIRNITYQLIINSIIILTSLDSSLDLFICIDRYFSK